MRTITLAIVIFLAFVAEAMAEPRVQVTFHGKPENFTAWPPIPPHAFIEFQGVYREKPLKHRAFGFSFLEPPAGTLEYYLVGAKAVAAETAGTLRFEGRDYVDNPQNVSLTTFVDDDTFDLMIAEIENWRLYPPDYSLLSINCVGFVDRLARIAGLNTPPWRQVYPDNYVRELFRLNKDKLVCSPPLPEGARKEDIIDRWVTSRRPFVRTDHPAWLQNVILQGQSGVIGRTIDDLMKKAADLERSFVGSSVIRRALENQHNAMVSAVSVADHEAFTQYNESLRTQMVRVAPLPGTNTRSLGSSSGGPERVLPCRGFCMEPVLDEYASPLRTPDMSTGAGPLEKIPVAPVVETDSPPRVELYLTGLGKQLVGSAGIVDLGPRVIGESARVNFRIESRYEAPMVVAVLVDGMVLDEASIRSGYERVINDRQLPRHVFMLSPLSWQEIAVDLPPIPIPANGKLEGSVPPKLILVANGEIVASLAFIYSVHAAERIDVRYRHDGWRSGFAAAFNEPPYSICSGESPPNYTLVGNKFSLKSTHIKHARSCNENTDGLGLYAVCRTLRTPTEICHQFQVQGHHKGAVMDKENEVVNFEVDVLWQYSLVRLPPVFVQLQRK